MTLSPEEIAELKDQLREQVQTMPESQRKQAEAQIEAMSGEAIELMLHQQQERASGKDVENKTIFRMIIDKEVTSYIIDENPDALAVLDINPIAKGHTLVIPKNAASSTANIPAGAFALAKKIAQKIIVHLKATTTDIQTEKKFGEAILHILPSYNAKHSSLASPRQKGIPEELEKIASTLKIEEKPKIETLSKTPAPPIQTFQLQKKIP